MPDFLVESYQATTPIDLLTGLPAEVRHVRSIFVPTDEHGLHLFAAPSADTLRDALARISFEYDRVVETRNIGEESR